MTIQFMVRLGQPSMCMHKAAGKKRLAARPRFNEIAFPRMVCTHAKRMYGKEVEVCLLTALFGDEDLH